MADEREIPKLFGAPAPTPAPGPEPATAPTPAPAPAPAQPSEGMLFLMQLGEGGIDDAQVEAALSERPSFRRADAEGSLEAVDGVPAVLAADRRAMRRRAGVAAAAIAVLALASLLVDPQGGLFSPAEVLACYDLAFHQLVASVVAPSDFLFESEVIAAHEAYFRVLDAVGATFATALCGAALGVGGLLLQSSFQRPFAVAPIIGVSAAVLACQGIALLATGAVLGISWPALVVACVAGLAPPVALRFRLNGLNLPPDVAAGLGVDPACLRRIADACAVVLLVVSQVRLGPAFSLAIALPPLARRLFGTEFRKALAGTALLGVAAVLLARLVPLPIWIPACVIGALLLAWQSGLFTSR